MYARRCTNRRHYEQIDERIIPYLRSSGFYEISQIGMIELDCDLITALVERWRPETHTFHLKIGESTVLP